MLSTSLRSVDVRFAHTSLVEDFFGVGVLARVIHMQRHTLTYKTSPEKFSVFPGNNAFHMHICHKKSPPLRA